jgi:hypothetical protein
MKLRLDNARARKLCRGETHYFVQKKLSSI